MKKKSKASNVTVKNPTAYRNYEFKEKYEAGIELFGTEVKSITQGKCNIKDSYCIIKNGECYILNMHISPYEFGNRENKEENRTRKLLLHKREILKLESQIKEQGMSLIPTIVYMKNNKFKVEIALGKGKKLYDKRQDIQKREEKIKISRAIKNYNNY